MEEVWINVGGASVSWVTAHRRDSRDVFQKTLLLAWLKSAWDLILGLTVFVHSTVIIMNLLFVAVWIIFAPHTAYSAVVVSTCARKIHLSWIELDYSSRWSWWVCCSWTRFNFPSLKDAPFFVFCCCFPAFPLLLLLIICSNRNSPGKWCGPFHSTQCIVSFPGFRIPHETWQNALISFLLMKRLLCM